MHEHFKFDIQEAAFEWDEAKDETNFRKYGIHFATAAKVFLDPNKLIREDEERPADFCPHCHCAGESEI